MKLAQHLERQGLGSPLLYGVSPREIVGKVLENQGFFVEGSSVRRPVGGSVGGDVWGSVSCSAFDAIEGKVGEMVLGGQRQQR